jgi:hypothetical protein
MTYNQDHKKIAARKAVAAAAATGAKTCCPDFRENEKGVTLLLSILVLSAITAIVFSIAAIAANEVRTSNDLVKSEPAITAAEAGAEDLLYYSVRGVGAYSTDCSAPSTTTLNGLTLSYCSNPYFADPYDFTLAGPSGEKDFYLYNPITPGAAPGYSNISVTLASGSSAVVNICSWTAANCASSADVASLSLTTGQTLSQALSPGVANGYQLVFLNSNSTSDEFIVTTTPTGMPSGTATIQTTGSNYGVTRKLQTILPQ